MGFIHNHLSGDKIKRILITPRENYHEKLESDGLFFYEDYWNESAYYEFNPDQINVIEKATNELCQMGFELVDYVIKNNLFENLKIPSTVIPYLIESWNNDDKTLYGRYDFVYDGIYPPKMLEYNADTPTSLLEASIIQWNWLKDKFPENDQFNSIHENLTEQIQSFNLKKLHLTYCGENLEDFTLVNYLSSICVDLNIDATIIPLEEIKLSNDYYIDNDYTNIENIFKLYPYEWMVKEHEFYKKKTKWIEPSWKMILSNKASLPLMWKMFPNHQNLLPSFFEPSSLISYVKKPIFSREGANISIIEQNIGTIVSEDCGYGDDGYVYQQLYPLPNFDGNFPVIGSWIIGETASGIGIREESNLITSNMAKFIPHLIHN